jgi:serine/threonine-protein kinase
MAEQRYQVIERIDVGGMAEVFKANSTSLQGYQKLVAIKRVLPELTQNERFVRMFLDEAKVSLHLNHTNIVQVFDLGIADGTYFIVMEYVDGSNLKKIIQLLGQRKQRVSVEQAVYIGLQVCKGLAHAHAKRDQNANHLGIVHRDISPPNVLVSRDGEVKITDFGLAKAKNQAEVTDPGVVKGKFGYLSPEAATGDKVDARTDIFAVGILVWEMLVGRRLFLGKTDYETLKQVQKAQIPSVAQFGVKVPAQLEQILARSLTREPGRRFQSAQDMGAALAQFLFSYGKVVSAFDIAGLVESVLEKKDERATAADVAAGRQVQRELNQLMSLEEMGNLDLFMAENYGEIDHDSEESGEYNGEGEDPREWMDLGFGGDDFAGVQEPEHHTPVPPGSGDSWQPGGLQDVARATQAMQAVKGPAATEPASKKPAPKNPAPQQKPAPPSGLRDSGLQNSGGPGHPRPTGPQPRPPAGNQPAGNQPLNQPAPIESQTPLQPEFPELDSPKASAYSEPSGKGPILLVIALIIVIIAAAGFILNYLDII